MFRDKIARYKARIDTFQDEDIDLNLKERQEALNRKFPINPKTSQTFYKDDIRLQYFEKTKTAPTIFKKETWENLINVQDKWNNLE